MPLRRKFVKFQNRKSKFTSFIDAYLKFETKLTSFFLNYSYLFWRSTFHLHTAYLSRTKVDNHYFVQTKPDHLKQQFTSTEKPLCSRRPGHDAWRSKDSSSFRMASRFTIRAVTDFHSDTTCRNKCNSLLRLRWTYYPFNSITIIYTTPWGHRRSTQMAGNDSTYKIKITQNWYCFKDRKLQCL